MGGGARSRSSVRRTRLLRGKFPKLTMHKVTPACFKYASGHTYTVPFRTTAGLSSTGINFDDCKAKHEWYSTFYTHFNAAALHHRPCRGTRPPYLSASPLFPSSPVHVSRVPHYSRQGSWNYRLKFDVDLPLKSPEHGRLVVQVRPWGIGACPPALTCRPDDLWLSL